jgi:uncharacterized protein YceK
LIRRALCIVLLLLASGCGTLITQIDGPLFAPGERAFNWDEQKVSPIYSGTRLSFGGARKSDVAFVWIIDLPLSFVADTAILPLSLLQDGVARIVDLFREPETPPAPEGPAPSE